MSDFLEMVDEACKAAETRKTEEANISQFKFETKTENGKTYSILTDILRLNDSDVIIPRYDLQGNPVTVIGKYAFSMTIAKMLDSTFDFNVKVERVTIPDSVTSIEEYAFCNCQDLTSITIPKSVTRIEQNAFRNCINLTDITVEEGNPVYQSIGNCLIETKTKTLYIGFKNSTIPNGVMRIGVDAFYDCQGLTSIIIPDGVIGIDENAFCKCQDLTSITISKSVTQIDLCAFSQCANLTNVTVEEGNPVYQGIGNCLIETQTKTLYIGFKNSIIPDSVMRIGTGAFYACRGLKHITIPNSVTYIEKNAFSNYTDMIHITVEKGNPFYQSIGNCLIETQTKTLHSGCKNSTIPYGVIRIGAGAFYDCQGLKHITIPDSVTSIEETAFAFCDDLTSITIPDSVTSIGESAFVDCEALKNIYYKGSPEKWAKIKIGANNEPLANATIHYK